METAEHRERYESRGSRTVLGAPGGEIPPGDSTRTEVGDAARDVGYSVFSRLRNAKADVVPPLAIIRDMRLKTLQEFHEFMPVRCDGNIEPKLKGNQAYDLTHLRHVIDNK